VIEAAGENVPKAGTFPDKKARCQVKYRVKSATLDTTINSGRRKI